MSDRTPSQELFWDIADEAMAGRDDIEEGTIMGSPCLRLDGDFLAMPHHKGDGIVVKIDEERVRELIGAGTGAPFAPAGKVFREWVLIAEVDETTWRWALSDALARRTG